ncbi:MAG: cytidylate kinase family protein [Ignavibacteriaceae bacterium]|nr:cytidylate kinase family protein [Ignavibacteriaceae bacterium]
MPVLFISRGTMSGVQELVKQFQERTGIRCISREDLLQVVAKHGDLALKVVTQLSEATSAYDHFSQLRRPYIILMRQALLQELLRDNILYQGFSGQLLVPRIKHFVRIRINASIDLRIPPTMEKFELDKENALKYIREMDEQRVRWARYTYGRDIRDPLLYDFQFNLGHISQKVLCGIMQNLMSEPELQASKESQTKVSKLLESTNIEAALVCDKRTRKFEIKAHYEIDKINLVGPYLEENELTIVKEIVRETVQVEEIEYTPGYTSTIDIDGWQQFMLPGTII